MQYASDRFTSPAGIKLDEEKPETVTRAKILVAKNPEMFRIKEPYLWVTTQSEAFFDNVYRWVIYNIGEEPND